MTLLRIILYFIPFFIMSCERNAKNSRRPYKGYTVESNWVDSIPSGITSFFDKDGRLYSNGNYINGQRQGWTIYFHKNGLVSDSVCYKNDLIDGFYSSYNEKGILISKEFFSRGFSFGPKLLYNNGKLTDYNFWTFEQVQAFSCKYDNFGRIKTNGKPFFVTTYGSLIDEDKRLGVFAYMAFAPGMNCNYELIERNTNKIKESVLRTFKDGDYFIDTAISISHNSKYYFRSNYFNIDSNKTHVIMTELN